MTQAIERVDLAIQVFGADRLAMIKEQISRGWKQPMTDAELEYAAALCQRARLDPLVKPAQIHFIQRWDNRLRKYVMTGQTSIDGLRLIAQRSRQYADGTPYQYTADGKEWTEVWLSDDPPAAAKVGVKRRDGGWFWGVATWKEWHQEVDEFDRQGNPTGTKKLSPFWQSKPAHMLGKTAEAMALKRAFPEETNELELAAIDEEAREQQAINNRRYVEIFGEEEDDVSTAESSGTAVVDGTLAGSPAVGAAPAGVAAALERNENLILDANSLGIKGIGHLKAKAWTVEELEVDKIEAANIALGAKIARFQVVTQAEAIEQQQALR